MVITTGKKNSSRLSGGCVIVITTRKKEVLVVCLAGARSLLGPFCQEIFVVQYVVRFIVPQIVPQIVQKPPQKQGTISEVFDTILLYDLRTPPPIGVNYRENLLLNEKKISSDQTLLIL